MAIIQYVQNTYQLKNTFNCKTGVFRKFNYNLMYNLTFLKDKQYDDTVNVTVTIQKV